MSKVYYSGKELLFNDKIDPPTKPNEKDFSGDQWKEQNAQQQYERDIQHYLDTATPVENQNLIYAMIEQSLFPVGSLIGSPPVKLVPGTTYYIDAGFKKVKQFRVEGLKGIEWEDLNKKVYDEYPISEKTRVVARLIPEKIKDKISRETSQETIAKSCCI